MRVGFIGLGSQGGPMARRIAESEYPTTLWARRAASLEPYADTPAATADSPAALAERSDLVCLCVVGDADVREVVTGDNGVLAGSKPGSIIAIHSTVHPDTCRELAALAAEHQVSIIDAPVSGGGRAAEAGNLLVMVGGTTDAVERARPVFATYADPIVHLGDLGAGQSTKLLNNLLFTANLATAMSTMDLGKALGISPDKLGEVISHGTANSFALGRITSAGGTLDRLAQHAGDLLRKDVSLVARLAETAGVDPGVVLNAADATLGMMDHPR
ncbi:3-hydroxyisobutyrate dehydrogenase-like beta-hydroxyacid dehydrogenase [Nocardia transvalensis]|uniref:3-hydroxyisobutyrate dehydrogenase-like beta-hydroxyacid dehydrogenase n=1 Tax=Nocardia transvalensis TaxID=37333 RepID=A0A7W9PH83_9NOCA|nr:NAD(P)-dependent oxidoreductase [Nocardia transvalensis]MBB5915584.1 3-hydroxyisobutyrate dehydrogenase-like beta-hydroxyacid dehydrogenase [Nocardia transvalensis]